jgi:hypothetical protein
MAISGGPVRNLHLVVTAGAVGALIVLVTSCSSVSNGPAAPPSARAQSAPPQSAQSASPTASAGQQHLGVSPPPPPSATGRLHVVLHDALPVTYGADQAAPSVIGTEAPDGSVFAAFGPEQANGAVAPAGSAVYVVDGDQPAQVAEHPTIPVTALAADDTYLYVGGTSQIAAYDRATGARARTWNVAHPVRLMAASAGRLWAVLGGLTGGQVVEINPSSRRLTTVGTDTANVASVAAGPQGIYYVESGGATIVHISRDGTRHQAPTNQTVNLQLSGPAAIQAISVIGDQVLVVHNAGQGLDSSSQTYNASTLAGPLANAPGTAGSNHAISSLAGPVDLFYAENISDSTKVGRYNLSSGAVTDAVTFPPDTKGLGPLLGPYPAVFVEPARGPVYLDRIG